MPAFTPYTSDDDIRYIAEGLLGRTLPKPRWTHAAHFAAAIWLRAWRPDLDLPRAMPGIIRSYNEATGGVNTDTEGYHETITLASLRAANAFVTERPDELLFRVCNAVMASELGSPDWLLSYWSRRLLFSAGARRSWTEPDLAALPF